MRADRLKILLWHGSLPVMANTPLDGAAFTLAAVRDGVMARNRAQFEALFARLGWRMLKAPEARQPAVAEKIGFLNLARNARRHAVYSEHVGHP